MSIVRRQPVKVIGHNARPIECGSSAVLAGWSDNRTSFEALLLADGGHEARPYRPRDSLRA